MIFYSHEVLLLKISLLDEDFEFAGFWDFSINLRPEPELVSRNNNLNVIIMNRDPLLKLLGQSVLIFMLVLMSSYCSNATKNVESDQNTFYDSVMLDTALNDKEKLGKLLFFEKSLSSPEGQDCAFCHDPSRAFSDPNVELPVSKGAIDGRYGNRNDMPVSYAAFVPPLHYDGEEEVWIGGLFWDGRANTLKEQAMGPPLNPLEMANPDTVTIFRKLMALPYSGLFNDVFGTEALENGGSAFANMARAMEAYQQTPEVSPFSSKYDYFLKGQVILSDQETRGMELFIAEGKGNCAACHPVTPIDETTPILFTDFTYDNLGIPSNPANPFLNLPKELNPDGFDFKDLGLGVTVNDPDQNGKFRVPTLRNISITAPYSHNGYFNTLWDIMAFYNTRDIASWPEPEIPETMNKDELGNLGLTNNEIEDIIAFLRTLTDGWEILE